MEREWVSRCGPELFTLSGGEKNSATAGTLVELVADEDEIERLQRQRTETALAASIAADGNGVGGILFPHSIVEREELRFDGSDERGTLASDDAQLVLRSFELLLDLLNFIRRAEGEFLDRVAERFEMLPESLGLLHRLNDLLLEGLQRAGGDVDIALKIFRALRPSHIRHLLAALRHPLLFLA